MQPAILLTLRPHLRTFDRGLPAHTYRIAGQTIVADRQVAELACFSSPAFAGPVPVALATSPIHHTSPNLVCHGQGFISGAWREVQCHSAPDGYRLSVAGVGTFSIDAPGTRIDLIVAVRRAAPHELEEALLGPVLILALALRGTWCLHASAVAVQGRAIVFVSESGRGKSTLAAFLASQCEAGWETLADDILPVTLTTAGLDALPRFPQLKAQPGYAICSGQPERVPVALVYVLAPSTTEGATCEIQPLTARGAALALVRHTVAARLFDHTLLARHLATCSEAAARVPVRRLTYPHQYDVLSRVCSMLATDLRTLSD